MPASPPVPTPPLPDDELAAALAATADVGVLPEAGLRAARRAAARAERLGRGADHAIAESWAITHLARMGRLSDVIEQSQRVLPRLDDPAPAMRVRWREVLRHQTMAASELGRFDLALDAAHRLTEESRQGGGADDALAATFLLAATLERMGDSWQALRLLTGAVSAYRDETSYALLVATNGVCAICLSLAHRMRDAGQDDERRSLLEQGRSAGERALAMLAQVRGDTYEVAVPGNLGEIRLLLGDLAGARPLLDRALALAESRGLKAHVWRISTSLADWHIAGGDPAEGLAQAAALVDEMGPDAPPQTVIRGHDAAYRASRALGRHDTALHHLERAERLERSRTLAQLRAQSRVLVTRSEVDLALADAAWHRQRAAAYAEAAERDALTGLGNRRHLERRAAELLPRAAAEQRPLALALIDADHFKIVNDRHGHAAGDEVLTQLAQLLRDNTRGGDVLARLGGEEFVIVLPDTPPEAAAELCERLRARIAAHGWPVPMAVTASIGLATAPPYELAAMLAAADAALYRAKAAGRNRLEAAAGNALH